MNKRTKTLDMLTVFKRSWIKKLVTKASDSVE